MQLELHVTSRPCQKRAGERREGAPAMAQKDMISARERRLRRAAARKGLAVRKVERGQDRGRYQLIDPEFGSARSSRSRTHPVSFSLEEAERYIGEM
jgi:hypothetical protein